jgi:ABC-type branched-subunit amino acid transport system ATPase component/ABC-type branched-subunit amino acid transport system permease subunit
VSALAAVLAFDAPKQVVFSGVVNGATYGIAAVGIILIYRSTRIINLAIAQMGGFSAALLARMVINWHANYWVAFAACVAVGGIIGWAIDRAVVRRLADAPRVIVLVATIGVAQLLLFAQAVLPQPALVTSYPTPIDDSWTMAGVMIRGEHMLILIIVPLLTAALALFINRTKYGVAVRAAAANRDAARLAAINVKRMSTLVWVLAGLLAATATILSAPIATTTSGDLITLGPGLLVRVLVAALIGRMVSPSLALAGGIVVGTGEALLFYNRPNDHGVLDLALLLVLLAALVPLARRSANSDTQSGWSFAPRVRPIPAALEGVWWVRRLPLLSGAVALLAGCLPLVFVHGASQQELWTRVVLYAMVAVSLTVLTGWAGQLSLGQFAFVGLGAMTTAALVRQGVGFAPAVGIAALVGGAAALVVGAPALRIPGLFLAVTSLAFAVAASSWLLSRSIFLHGDASVTMPRAVVGSFSLAPQRTYYVVCFAALLIVLVVVSRLRRSGFGRSLIAVRDNERAAAAMGLSPARVKLTAFAISGAIAGLAGGLLAGLYVTFGAERFTATESLQVVAIAVIGGLASVTGTVLGALFVVGLPVAFSDSPNVALLTSGAGLLVLLLFVPGGLVQLLFSMRDALFARVARGLPPPTPAARPARMTAHAIDVRTDAATSGDVIRVRELTVQFDGRAAVEMVDLDVGRGEVVGLIGSNGAGKSTVMNAIGGFVPNSGTIRVLGTDVGRLSAARRARLGLGRTFQGAELFGDLNVRETVALALEAQTRASLASVMIGIRHAGRVERSKRARADEIVAFLGLGDFADRFVSELSTGTRRILELACLVASEARVLCLDEPTAGLAQREAEAFGPLLLEIRRELDASVLLIEHDMAVVMGVSDRVYCLEAGRLLADGTPAQVRTDPLVIASYLGAPPPAAGQHATPESPTRSEVHPA